MRQYLIEGVTGAFPFIVDRTKPPVVESRPNGGSFTRIPGRFSVCDTVNGNNRLYRKQVWEKNLQQGSILQESIGRNAAFGLLEHPKDGIVTLQSPISHHVTKAQIVESKDATGKSIFEIVGEISLYNPTLIPESGKLLGLIEGGYNPLVSSRGYGSLEKTKEGVDEVKEDYVCEGWDVVIKPSFDNAELTPDRSATNAKLAEPYRPNPQAESKPGCPAGLPGPKGEPGKPILIEDDPEFQKRLVNEHKVVLTKEAYDTLQNKAGLPPQKESQDLKAPPSTGQAKPTSETKPKSKTMELTEIKLRVDALRNVDPARRRFAESMTQIEELHQDVAEWAAADTKRSWEAQKLHKTLEAIAGECTETIKAPAKEVKRLGEHNNKLMKVIDAVAKTAVSYKKKLGESLKADGSRVKMIEELTRRGQGWQRIAESRKQKFVVLEKDFDTSCEALDLMAQRYHEDVTELGRRLINLEFKDKAQAKEIQDALKQATRLRHIVAIREKLEGKPKKDVQEDGGDPGGKQPKEGEAPSKEAIKDGKTKGAGSPDEGKVAKEPGKVTNESKDDGKPATIPEAKILKPERGDLSVRAINESVDLVRRLSPVPAK